jgi:hypothetical protein
VHITRRTVLGGAVVAAVVLAVAAPAPAVTAVKPYVAQVGEEYQVRPLFSVADQVPETSDPARRYQMIGLPDGLGAHPNGDGTSTLFMNHEVTGSTVSEPLVGGPLQRGTFVSKWILDADGDPVSGERGFDTVFLENTLVGPAAEVGNSTPAFSRFCSGSLAGPAHGFDRWIYLTNEEDTGANTFDGKGGISVAIFDNEAHALPRLGHFSKENTLVQPTQSDRTVVFSLEDGPASPDSQLYMYVGKKDDDSSDADPLRRNGLDNGTLYVFRSTTPGMTSEVPFQAGSITGEWVPIPGAEAMTDAQLEAASDALGAFGFIRIEDGTFNPNNRNELFFVTTGGATGNQLGRLYSVLLNPGNPTQPATLTVAYNADQVIAAGGDIAISPDNVDASGRYLMINEDGTATTRPVMAAKGRDGSIWRLDLVKGPVNAVGVDASTATRVAELDPPGRDGVPVGPGVWETSGIIDTSRLFGADTWLSDVQAHPPTAAPALNTVEDGQLFLLRPAG